MILTNLQSFGLDLSYLRGQAYDGAGNMSGSIRGTAAIITQQHSQALYLHCASHCLNLVVKSLALTSVRNMMNITDTSSLRLTLKGKESLKMSFLTHNPLLPSIS